MRKHVYTKFFNKNVQPEICKVLRTCPEHTRVSEKNNSFFTAFTFLDPENLNYIMSYMESECVKNFVLSTHSIVYGQ